VGKKIIIQLNCNNMDKMGLEYLNQKELKEINGGMPLLIWAFLLANNCLKRTIDCIKGYNDGYEKGVSTQ
jgi:bacteriocin-like protein